MLIIFRYILLGIIQGFTEPLPISSSGHIFILKNILNMSDILNDLNFEIVVNFGSLIAIILIYFKDLKRLFINFFKYIKTKDKGLEIDFKYVLLVILGCIPIGIIGFILKEKIELLLQTTTIVGISFIITSIFLFLVKNINGNKENITWKDALFIGLIQVIALLPGISRSGSTLIAALFRNIKRDNALKYSFMLYIPISVGTMILSIKDIIFSNLNNMFLPYILGFISSLIVSYFALRWFINAVKKGNLLYFSIYCLILGIFILIFL
jgi:undecaprenyl-diphosphatase